MTNSNQVNKLNFLYPQTPYHGQFNPKNLAFNANLQEFAQRSAYISGLHTNGKLSSAEAYKQLKNLWKQLKHSKKAMEIDPLEPPREP